MHRGAKNWSHIVHFQREHLCKDRTIICSWTAWWGSQQFPAPASGWGHLGTILPYLPHSSLLCPCPCVSELSSPYLSFLPFFHPNNLVENKFLLCTEPTKIKDLSNLLSFFHTWDLRAAQDARIGLKDGPQLTILSNQRTEIMRKSTNNLWVKYVL